MKTARMTMSGGLPGGEIWEAGFALTTDDASDFSMATAISWANAWMGAWGSIPAGLMAYYGPAVTWNPMKVEELDATTGQVVSRTFGSVGATSTGSGAVASFPNHVATVVSLAGFGAGPSRRGRFYLPAPLTTAGSPSGKMLIAYRNAVSNAVGNAFTNASSIAGAHFRLGFRHGATDYQPARYATVGDVFDNMRTRRNKLVEARSTVLIGYALS